MNFLQQLDEAANIPLEELKSKLQKDKRVSLILKRDSTVNDVKNVPEFIKTMRYYVFSNPQVRAYMEKRGDRRDLSKGAWKSLAALKPTDNLSAGHFDWMKELIKLLFKDLTYITKKDLSKRATEWLLSNFSGDRVYPDVYAMREVESLGLKPEGPITVYRGLIFNEREMSSSDFGGSEGLKFLQSVRRGKAVADLNYERATVWTTDRNEALSNALYGRDSSWKKYKEGDAKKIERYSGVLAFVVSKLATPDDIVAQMSEYAKVGGWPPESDSRYHGVLLKPGRHLARVVSKFTQQGEEDVLGTTSDVDVDALKRTLVLLSKLIKLPTEQVRTQNDYTFQGLDRWTHDVDVMQQIAALNDPELHERVGTLLDAVLNVYNKHLKDINPKDLSDQVGQHGNLFDSMREIHELFRRHVVHEAYRKPEARLSTLPTVYIKDLRKGEDMLTARPFDSALDDAVTVIAGQKRWTQWKLNSVWLGLARIADPNIQLPEKLHLAGWKQQQPIVDAAVKGLYTVMGQNMPAQHAEQAKDFKRWISTAMVTGKAVNFLLDLKSQAGKADA